MHAVNPSLTFCRCDKTLKNQVGGERVYCTLQIRVWLLLREAGVGPQNRNLEAGTEAEVVVGYCSTAFLGVLSLLLISS